MKKSVTQGLGVLVALLFVGCVQDAADQPEQELASPELQATVEASEAFQQARAQLEQEGNVVALERSAVVRHGSTLGVVCPVESTTDQPSEYSSLVFQSKAGARPEVSLELSGQPAVSSGKGSTTQNYTCGGWGSWYTISTFCQWHIMCLGDATMLVRERARTCCATSCWIETEHTTVRNRCGC